MYAPYDPWIKYAKKKASLYLMFGFLIPCPEKYVLILFAIGSRSCDICVISNTCYYSLDLYNALSQHVPLTKHWSIHVYKTDVWILNFEIEIFINSIRCGSWRCDISIMPFTTFCWTITNFLLMFNCTMYLMWCVRENNFVNAM